jgi:hypothetical protein
MYNDCNKFKLTMVFAHLKYVNRNPIIVRTMITRINKKHFFRISFANPNMSGRPRSSPAKEPANISL